MIKTDTPIKIDRYFAKKEHQVDFLNGNIRFGHTEYYRNSAKEKRRNPRDGFFKGYIRSGENPGFYTYSILTFSYILSFSIPCKNPGNNPYGEYLVSIHSPKIFIERILDIIGRENIVFSDNKPVEYTRSSLNAPNYNDVFFTNDYSHVGNREYRFLIQIKDIDDLTAKNRNVHFSEEQEICAEDIQIPRFMTISGVQMNDLCN